MIEFRNARQNPEQAAFHIHFIGQDALIANTGIVQAAEESGSAPEALARERYDTDNHDLIQTTYDEILASDQDESAFTIAYTDDRPIAFTHTKRNPAVETGSRIETVQIEALYVRQEALRRGVATQLVDRALSQYNNELPLTFTANWWDLEMRKWGERYYFNGGFEAGKESVDQKTIKYIAESISLVRTNMRQAKPELFS